MVKSKLNPNQITYPEDTDLDENDIGYETPVYELYKFHKKIPITLGKANYQYSKRGVVFFPIYIVDLETNEILSKIGIYEVETDKVISIFDEDEDVEISKLRKPLFFKLFDETYVQSVLSSTEPEEDIEISVKKSDRKDVEEEEEEEETEVEPEQDDIFALGKPTEPSDISRKKAQESMTETDMIFEDVENFQMKPKLEKETKQIADKIKKDFSKSSKHKWIVNFTHNENYDIIENDAGGDCFFYVIRDAFLQIGKKTSVETLRKIVSQEMTEEVFKNYKQLYKSLEGGIEETKKEILRNKKILAELKKRKDKTQDLDTQKKIVEDATTIKVKYQELVRNQANQEKFLEDSVGFMRNIGTIEQMKEYIRTSQFWADTWAISTLERLLNIKMIFFSEESFKNDDKNGVFICGEGDKSLMEKGTFQPDYYIMTSYSGDHFRLVTYREHAIFTFDEIPYDIHVFVLNRCLERNSGIFHLIPDYKNLKRKYGLTDEEGNDVATEEDENEPLVANEKVLYNKEIVFQFYALSDKNKKPGKGNGESIPIDRIPDFVALEKEENWRRMLDDEWIDKFKLDDLEWASVEHYYQACKFKKTHPDFYRLFSLTSGNEISSSVELAKGAGSKSGKIKDKILRPKNIQMDSDFYPKNKLEYRKNAVYAKFHQNAKLKKVLLLTNPAKLQKFIAKNPPEIDIILMEVRHSLIHEK